jgi:hypothetical protein
MKQERAHEERVARLHRTDDLLLIRAGFDDIGGIQSSHSMRARDNTKGAVRFVTIIQMESQCDHAFQYSHRRLNVRYSLLD